MAKGAVIFSARVNGFDEMLRKLRTLKESVRNQALTAAVDAGAAEVQQMAQVYAPRDTWALAGAIARKTRKASNAGLAESKVGIDKNVRINGRRPVRYAHLVEFGHYARDGSRVAAQPFIRPALQAAAGMARRAMAAVLKEHIRKAVA